MGSAEYSGSSLTAQAKLLQFPDARLGPLHDGHRLQPRICSTSTTTPRISSRSSALDENLEENQVPIAIHDEPRKLIRFTKHQTAGVGVFIQHALAQPKGSTEYAASNRGQPGRHAMRTGSLADQAQRAFWDAGLNSAVPRGKPRWSATAIRPGLRVYGRCSISDR
jgi:hypothetical protein